MVELLNDIVNCPITEPRILTETVKEFLLVLMRIPTLEKVPIEQLNYTLHLFTTGLTCVMWVLSDPSSSLFVPSPSFSILLRPSSFLVRHSPSFSVPLRS